MLPQGPVGARLRFFWRTWMLRSAEPWVVEVLREGYQIPFLSPPPLSKSPIQMSAYQPASDRFRVLQQEVAALLEKGAIEEVVDPSPGFYNR